MENLLLWGFYILTFYAFLPGIISRTFGFRVFKKGRVEREIALTFDDGPDPEYTPKLLDLLAKYEAKATFFVVGVNAERNPELLVRMKDEGHNIGIHNYVHKSNWLMRPKAVKKQIHRTSEVIKKATGSKSAFYRPPWGIVNLFDFSNLGYLQIILWSSMFGDWRRRVGVDRLTKRMMKKLRPGEVVLLHDCGTTLGADQEAPANMLRALEIYLREGRKRGYRFVTISEMIELTDKAKVKRPQSGKFRIGLFKRAVVSLWMGWERLFHILFRLEPIDGGKSIFHFRIREYKGEPLQLNNGARIGKNDRIIELHFDNGKLLHAMRGSKSVLHTAIYMIREVEKAMPKLAAQIAGRREYEDVRGLYGISMIHRGSESFGFHVFDLPEGLFNKMTQFYLRLLIKVLHPAGKGRMDGKRASLVPRMMVMSMEDFYRRYAVQAEDRLVRAEADKDERPHDLASGLEGRNEYEQNKAAKELVP
ncbi:polysaccharide deacetylase family protein [Paenibacillus tarimensis]